MSLKPHGWYAVNFENLAFGAAFNLIKASELQGLVSLFHAQACLDCPSLSARYSCEMRMEEVLTSYLDNSLANFGHLNLKLCLAAN